MHSRLSTVVALVVVLLLLGLVVAPAASPARLGYVTTSSMEPTLDAGDGYLAVPAGEVQTGEIVVFWSPDRGEYVVHRVVGETDRGFLTRGDANAATDQAAGHPPVPRSAIVGEVLTLAGRPVVLPGLGGFVSTIRSYRVLLFGVLLLVLAALAVRRRRRRTVPSRPGRSVYRVRDVVYPALGVAFVTMVAVTPLGANAYQLAYAADDPSASTPGDRAITRNVSIDAFRMPFTRVVVRGEGLTIVNRSWNGTVLSLDVAIPPPGATSAERIAIHVYPYPALLPADSLERLHDAHPAIASVASAIVGVLPLYVLYALLLDGRRPLGLVRTRWMRRLRGE